MVCLCEGLVFVWCCLCDGAFCVRVYFVFGACVPEIHDQKSCFLGLAGAGRDFRGWGNFKLLLG